MPGWPSVPRKHAWFVSYQADRWSELLVDWHRRPESGNVAFMSESTYEPGDDGSGADPDDIVDLDQAFGDDDVDGTVFETSYSPPERSNGDRFGTTWSEEEQGESLDQRLAQEVPDPALASDLGGDDEDDVDRVDSSTVPDDQLSYGEIGGDRAGRLVDPDEGLGPDEEKDLVGDDVGIDEGAASAEEAAVHIID
jgi:hypothetical protein